MCACQQSCRLTGIMGRWRDTPVTGVLEWKDSGSLGRQAGEIRRGVIL